MYISRFHWSTWQNRRSNSSNHSFIAMHFIILQVNKRWASAILLRICYEWNTRWGITTAFPLQWGHNALDGVSNHQSHDWLFTQPFFRHRSQKTSKLRVTGLCAQRAGNAEMFPFDDVMFVGVVTACTNRTEINSGQCTRKLLHQGFHVECPHPCSKFYGGLTNIDNYMQITPDLYLCMSLSSLSRW